VTSYVNLGNIVSQQSLFFALILLAGGVAAALLPSRRPDLITLSGTSDAERQSFLRKVATAGWVTTILALFVVIEILIHPSVYGRFSVPSTITLVVVLGAGPVIYVIARAIRRRRNALDISLAMHELPPD